MAVPLAEGRTRSDFFQPLVKMGVLFAQSTWPKAVDEDPASRPFLAMVVDAFNLDPDWLLFSVAGAQWRRGKSVSLLGWRVTLGGLENLEGKALNLFEMESGQCFESGAPVLG